MLTVRVTIHKHFRIVYAVLKGWFKLQRCYSLPLKNASRTNVGCKIQMLVCDGPWIRLGFSLNVFFLCSSWCLWTVVVENALRWSSSTSWFVETRRYRPFWAASLSWSVTQMCLKSWSSWRRECQTLPNSPGPISIWFKFSWLFLYPLVFGQFFFTLSFIYFLEKQGK